MNIPMKDSKGQHHPAKPAINAATAGNLDVGYRLTVSKTLSENDIELFSKVTGDANPLHLDEAFAQKTIFKGRIAHGMLTAGLISAALSKLPGIVVYISQDIHFLKPVRIGQTIQAAVQVIERIEDRSEYRLKTTCTDSEGRVVVDGEAKIRILKME